MNNLRPVKILFLSLLVLSGTCALYGDDSAVSGKTGALIVEITGLKNDSGTVLVQVCNSRETFLKDGKAFREMSVPIQGKTAKVVLADLPFGIYTILVVHDANGNGKMEKNFLGIPLEGCGFSNNKKLMGPPNYDAVKFTFDGTTGKIAITIVYL